MQERYSDYVTSALAQHLGVSPREISPVHHLYRDWGLTPLSLIVILLDLERIVAIELPSHELGEVRTVGELIAKFRGWAHAGAPDLSAYARRRARRSRNALRARRLRRELHHLRWLERNVQTRNISRLHSAVLQAM